jgi:hypothetical protein
MLAPPARERQGAAAARRAAGGPVSRAVARSNPARPEVHRPPAGRDAVGAAGRPRSGALGDAFGAGGRRRAAGRAALGPEARR